MVDTTKYLNIGKDHLLTSPADFCIFIYGVETKIGKYLYDLYTADGMTVVAPLRSELDISNLDLLQDFHSAFALDNDNFSCVINCESYYNDSEYTPDEFIARHKNLITFSSWNGGTYGCLSNYQVFDGTVSAKDDTPRNPLTLQGSIFSEIESFLETTFVTNLGNYHCVRLPWLFSYSEGPLDLYETDLTVSIKDFATGRSSIDVASNIECKPYNLEVLLTELPYYFLSSDKGFYNLGALSGCSLAGLATVVLEGTSTTVNSIAVSNVSGSAGADEFKIISPIDNICMSPSYLSYGSTSLNLIKLDTMFTCYRNKSTAVFDTVPLLKPIWWFLNPAYDGVDYADVPQECIDELQAAFLLPPSVDTDQSEYDIDKQVFEYLFT